VNAVKATRGSSARLYFLHGMSGERARRAAEERVRRIHFEFTLHLVGPE
jgi:hypothetical protein